MHAVHMTRREAINTKAIYFYKSPLDQALQGKLAGAGAPVETRSTMGRLSEVAGEDLNLLSSGVGHQHCDRLLHTHDHACLALVLPAVHAHIVPHLRASTGPALKTKSLTLH